MDTVVVVVLALAAVLAFRALRAHERERFIRQFSFPSAVRNKLRERYPDLAEEQVSTVMRGLREYFLVCRMAGNRMVAMPSQAVDAAWHELILFTRAYEAFCRRAFGRFLHHTPAEAMSSPRIAQDGIKRAWRLSCRREGVNPRRPVRLPLLFAIDSELGIADGFRYALDCSRAEGYAYCASHIGCGGGCAGGCAADAGHGSGGCGADGGGGCGGGCGGD